MSETEALDVPFGQDEQRYMEIWNLVFMQFDRSERWGADAAAEAFDRYGDGVGADLPCVLQGVMSNYETDLFTSAD